jgi:hypothetical protein
MFKIKEKANPIGVVHKISCVEERVQFYISAWRSREKKRSIWGSSEFSKATSFILYALDDFIIAAMTVVISGPDKKATVLDAVSRLYDFTAEEVLPIWMKPIAVPIKQYVIHVLVSVAIDWIVSKYNNSEWIKKEAKKKAWDGVYLPCLKNCRKGDA